MSRLRKSILFLVLHLLIVFNLGKLSIGGQNIVVIQPIVYILVSAAVILLVAAPIFRHVSIYASLSIWVTTYFTYRLFTLAQRPLLAGYDIYMTITDLAFISISVFLANEVGYSIKEIDSAIEKITFAGIGQKVFQMDNAVEDIQIELNRSRRYGRPLSVLVVKPLSGSMNAEMRKKITELQNNMLNRYLLGSFAQSIGQVVRRTDMIIEESERDRFIVLCPETTPEGLTILAERIQAAVGEKLGISTVWGSASFPDEALTFESLVAQAEQHLVNEFGNRTKAPADVNAVNNSKTA